MSTDKTLIMAADSGTHCWQLNLLSGRFSQVLEVLHSSRRRSARADRKGQTAVI